MYASVGTAAALALAGGGVALYFVIKKKNGGGGAAGDKKETGSKPVGQHENQSYSILRSTVPKYELLVCLF